MDVLFFPAMISITPSKDKIGQKDSGFKSLKKKLELSIPDKLKIQEVKVVPILEPIIISTVWDNSIIPEFTKPTSITVNADEL